MANHKSTLKRMRQNVVRRAHNRHYRSTMRTQIKSLQAAIAAGNADGAREELKKTTSIIHTLASKGIIHANQAARRVSRLTQAVNKM